MACYWGRWICLVLSLLFERFLAPQLHTDNAKTSYHNLSDMRQPLYVKLT